MSERWKMNRIGFVNFWLYDEEDFEFEDGKLLLRGQNGSGKSITTQSFIPFVLDGDRTPSRLDPFGSSDRRMEYYFLGEEGKEESTGYLFLEFWKEDSGEYRTIGIGQKAKRGKPIIHQPDGETGEKSENVQEQIGKESEAPAKISAPTPSQTGENIKEIRLVCQNSTKKKIQRTFGSEIFCKIKGEDNFIVTVEVVVDKAFFGWLTSMGRNVHILKPKKAAVAYRDYLKNIAKDYKGIDK